MAASGKSHITEATRFDGGDPLARIEGLTKLSEVGVRAANDDEVFGDMAQAVNGVLHGIGGYLHLFVDDKAALRRFGPAPGAVRVGGRFAGGRRPHKWLMEKREPIIMDYTHPHAVDRIPALCCGKRISLRRQPPALRGGGNPGHLLGGL